jgi:tetratricopeptide (TPR) repeat protein
VTQTSHNRGWNRSWLLGLLLVTATILAYQKAWHAGFIWDDNDYVTENPLLSAPDGLQRIWFSLDSPSQYFPAVYTTFRLEYAQWGLNPTGYHWVNLLLHTLNALLVWRLLTRLKIPGAWLAAAIFALHPVNVESVAWVTQLKNVQSLFFSLLTLLAWVKFIEASEGLEPRAESLEDGRNAKPKDSALSSKLSVLRFQQPHPWRWYALALLLYALALSSKTTACTLPAALLLILWLKQKPFGWIRLAQIIPFLLLGVAMGYVSIWWERHHQGTEGAVYTLSLLERTLIATRAVWFYLGKLLWPVNLCFNYPLWKIDPANPLAYLWLVAGVALAAAIYSARRFVGRGLETAAVFYVAMLSPLLGFIMLYTFRYTFVTDHYQYVATLGPIALLAAAISTAQWAAVKNHPWLKPAFCGALLAVLATLTWRQCAMYANLETLWRTTIATNPDSFMGHNNLGAIFLQQNRLDEAAAHFQRAVEIEPASHNAHFNLAQINLHYGRVDAAIAHFEKVLEIQPDDAQTHHDLAAALLQSGRAEAAVAHCETALKLQPNFVAARSSLAAGLFQLGRVDEAIAHFQKVLDVQPDNAEVHNNLGWCLLQSGHENEAAAHFETVLKLQPDFAPAYANLALACLQQGRTREAVGHFQSFLKLQPDAVPVLSRLAWLLATSSDAVIRNGAQALELAQRANQISGGRDPTILQTLAAAYAEHGQFGEAAATARLGLELTDRTSQTTLHNALQVQLTAYQAGRSFHEIGEPAPRGSGDTERF